MSDPTKSKLKSSAANVLKPIKLINSKIIHAPIIKTQLPERTTKIADPVDSELSSVTKFAIRKNPAVINPAKPIILDRTKLRKPLEHPTIIKHRNGSQSHASANTIEVAKRDAIICTKKKIDFLMVDETYEKAQKRWKQLFETDNNETAATSVADDQAGKEEILQSIKHLLNDEVNFMVNLKLRKPTACGIKFINGTPSVNTTPVDVCYLQHDKTEPGGLEETSENKINDADELEISANDPKSNCRAGKKKSVVSQKTIKSKLDANVEWVPSDGIKMRQLYQIPNGRDETIYFVKCFEHVKMNELNDEYTVKPGDTFQTIEQFVEYVNGHAKRWKFYYSLISSLGPQTRNDRYMKKYIYTCIFCARHAPPPDKVYKRKRMNKYHSECPSRIVICQIRGDDHLTVVTTCDHHDHPFSDELFYRLPHFTKLPLQLKEEVYDLLLQGMNIGVVKQYLFDKTGFEICGKSLINTRKNLRANKMTRKLVNSVEIIQQKIQMLNDQYASYKIKTNPTKEERLTKRAKDTLNGRVRKRSRKNAGSKKRDSADASAVTVKTEETDDGDLTQRKKRLNESSPLRANKRSRLEERLAGLSGDQEVLESVRQLQASVRNTSEDPSEQHATLSYEAQGCKLEDIYDNYYEIGNAAVDSEYVVIDQSTLDEKNIAYTHVANDETDLEHHTDDNKVAVQVQHNYDDKQEYFLHDGHGNVITDGVVEFDNNYLINVSTLLCEINKQLPNVPECPKNEMDEQCNAEYSETVNEENNTGTDIGEHKSCAEIAVQTDPESIEYQTSFRPKSECLHTREIDYSNLYTYVDSENRTIKEEYINQYNLHQYLMEPDFPNYIESLANNNNMGVMHMLPSILNGKLMIKVTHTITPNCANQNIALSLITCVFPRADKRKEMQDIERYKYDASLYFNTLTVLKSQMEANLKYIKCLSEEMSDLRKDKLELIENNKKLIQEKECLEIDNECIKELEKLKIQLTEKDKELKSLEKSNLELAEQNKKLMKTSQTLHGDKQQLVSEYEKLYRMYYKLKNRRMQKSEESSEDLLLKTNLVFMKKNAMLEEKAMQLQLQLKEQKMENNNLKKTFEIERSVHNSLHQKFLSDEQRVFSDLKLNRTRIDSRKRVIHITDAMKANKCITDLGSLTVTYNENIIIIEDNLIQDSDGHLMNKIKNYFVKVMEEVVKISWLSLFKNEDKIIHTDKYEYATKLSQEFINSERKYDKMLLYRMKELEGTDKVKNETYSLNISASDEARDAILYVRRDGVEVIELNGRIKCLTNVQDNDSNSEHNHEVPNDVNAEKSEVIETYSDTEIDSTENTIMKTEKEYNKTETRLVRRRTSKVPRRIDRSVDKYSKTKSSTYEYRSKMLKRDGVEYDKFEDAFVEFMKNMNNQELVDPLKRQDLQISVKKDETRHPTYYCTNHSGLHVEKSLVKVGDSFASHAEFAQHLKENANKFFAHYMFWQLTDVGSVNETHTYSCYFLRGKRRAKTRCPCKITLKRLLGDSRLTVVLACHHHTHELDMEKHFTNQRFSPKLNQKVMNLLARKVDKTKVKAYIEMVTGVSATDAYIHKMEKDLKMIQRRRKAKGTLGKPNSKISEDFTEGGQ